MMDILLNILSWLFLLSGSFFCIIGGLGLLRFPDFYTRIHAGGVTDTLGAGLILLGLCFQAGMTQNTVKLLLILGFLWITSAMTAHALVKAAFFSGLKPELAEDEGEEAA